MWDAIIKNGTIVTDSDCYQADIYVKDGKIAHISAEPLPGDSAEITDAAGKYIFPGFIETHVHSRDGRNGLKQKEDFFTSTAAAAGTGITTVFEMPNCNPPIYSVENLKDLVQIIEPKAHTDFCVWGLALGDANLQQLQSLSEAGVVAFKFFWGYAIKKADFSLVYNYRPDMTDVLPPPDEGQIWRIFREVKKTGKLIGIHAENFNIIKDLTAEIRATGADDYEALLRTRPAACETSVIDTAIDMAQQIGNRLHIIHVGVGEGVDHIRRAKADGVALTSETCSHYLALTNEDAPRCGAVIKTYPLIRTKWDQEKVWEGLIDGTIDYVCSDHAPHTWEEKQRGFWEAPAGISGVEALSPVLLTAVNEGKLSLQRFVQVTSTDAAKIYGLYPKKGAILPGSDADFAIVDMDEEYIFDQAKMKSKAKWTPYHGMPFKGRVIKTILRGKTTMENGEIAETCPGKFIAC